MSAQGEFIAKTGVKSAVPAVGDYLLMRSGYWVRQEAAGLLSGPYSSANGVSFAAAAGGSVGVVVNDTSAAAANVTAIQAALDAGGDVSVLSPGVVFINNPLSIGSNTHLKLAAGTTIKLTGGTTKNMLVSKAYLRTSSFIAATASWVSGVSLPLAKVAHGLSVGDYVFVFSATLAPSQYVGVFPVTTVTDANNFIVNMHRPPSAAHTGTMQYILADVNVRLSGGEWDQDTGVNSGGTGQALHGIILGGIANGGVNGVVINRCTKYCLNIGATYNFHADGIFAEKTSSDLVKVYGPFVAGSVKNVGGTCADDVVSLQAKEAAGFSQYMWTFGDMQNPLVENISGTTGAAGTVSVYCSPNEYTGGVVLRNIGGASPFGVSLALSYIGGVINDVVIDNDASTGPFALRTANYGYTGGVIRSLIAKGLKLAPDTFASNQSVIALDANITINNFVVDGLLIDSSVWPSATSYAMTCSGTIGTMTLQNSRFNGASNVARFCQFTGTATNVNILNNSFTSSWSEVFNMAAGTPTFNISGNDLNNLGAVVATTVATTVVLNGNRINVGGNGVVRSNAAVAIKVKGSGNNYVGGSIFTNGSGTGLWEFYGMDFALDVGATGVQKTITGQYCFNNGAARGTLVQNRLVTCNGTNWVQVDVPANVF